MIMEQIELIMELKLEQGGSRIKQVQPPDAVWEQFFGVRVDAGSRPTFRLQNLKSSSPPEQRKVVKHDHNLTIEIGDAALPRPAILRVKKLGVNSFGYWVYRPPSKEFAQCNGVLRLFGNEKRGRRWLLISHE